MANQRGRKSTTSRPGESRKAPGASAKSAAGLGAPGRARTIVFVHGIGNKPKPEVLKCQWDRALFSFDLGERSRLAYWVDRERYPDPEPGTCASGDRVTDDAALAAGLGGATALALRRAEANIPLEAEAADLAQSDEARASLLRLAQEMQAGIGQVAEGHLEARAISAKVLPLPAPIRRWITRRLTRALLGDVHDFFYVEERRRVMRESVLERLRPGGGPFVVIGHSQGSMIAWDVLCDLDPAEFDVELFVTIGSPLGLTEVRDQLKRFRKTKSLAVPPCVRAWHNFADPLDPVCLDKRLAGEFRANARGVGVEDDLIVNEDSPRHPHSGTGYLSDPKVRIAVRETVEPGSFQPVASFVLARDLVHEMENGSSEARHEVLIELVSPSDAEPDLAASRDRVVARIESLAAESGAFVQIEQLRHFVAARLTREEAERLSQELGQKGEKATHSVAKVWRNAKKVALLDRSAQTVQATAARIAYAADGEGVHWAILDTGIRADHPHFAMHGNIFATTDCTSATNDPSDRFGHGTHVAGIVAGEYQEPNEGKRIAGIAPKAKLHIYKVLADDGSGRDSWIIKALDDIASKNEQAGRPLIQGVNLSLGGGFDQSVYACGWSPLCRELRRLWRQGVLVVIAAGNEGFAVLESATGPIDANMDLSIGDPANLEEAIAVGSIHKEFPHSYGISYFSSRGPTADGRRKPDLVAPGEKIVSCRHRWSSGATKLDELYVEMSGTSMAAPHVSGILAAFLSVRREFSDEPDKVKRLLLAHCTDLERDRPMQGAGMPNLVKMLVNT
jgi:subtilisin family serine protease